MTQNNWAACRLTIIALSVAGLFNSASALAQASDKKSSDSERLKEVEVVGPPHDRVFTMGVLDPNGAVIATATARNKQVAEQEASRLALLKVNSATTSSE